MKKSEELALQAVCEDNDIKSFGIMCKVIREQRSERFVEDWLPLLNSIYEVEQRSNGSYSIKTEKYGIIDFFPKANKLLVRKDNDWIKPALKWIRNNIIPQN